MVVKMGYYKYLRQAWKKPRANLKESYKELLVKLRSEESIKRLEKPTRPDRAHSLGYKAKQGFVIARVSIKKGKRKRERPHQGRKPKTAGQLHYYPKQSFQVVAEQRATRKYPNLEVLNSYMLAEDGQHKWFEVILLDKHHPAIKKDKDVKWITEPQHQRRALRGLTSAGRKSRGMKWKGKGAEKIRPSIRAHDTQGK